MVITKALLRLGARGLVYLLCSLLLLEETARAQSPVSVSIQTQSPGASIPPDFLGLSFETGNLKTNAAGVSGYMFDSSSATLITLFTNLGIRNLRIGGTSTDTNNGNILFYFPTNEDIDALFRFVKAAGVEAIVSLQLEHGNPAADAVLAGYTWSNYNQYMTCFAIGNEPDAYGTADPTMTNFSSYLARWTTFATTITNAVPGVKIGGPDGAGTAYTGPFANAEVGSSLVTSITSHLYVVGNATGLTPQQVISGLLSASLDTSSDPSQFNLTQAVADENGFPFRYTEFNSYYVNYPGVWGGNNSFASSLFACDAAHWWAAHNCNGVNFHTFLGKYNATLYYDTSGHYQIYPIGYGIKAFEIGSHGNVMPLTLTNASSLNLTAYAVGNNTNIYVTIVNRENGTNARDASVTIFPNGFVTGSVQSMYLTDPGGVGATNGVTLGGAIITNNAPFLGQWTAMGSLTNSQFVLTVPASSAAIINIRAATIYDPPVIVKDLPPTVHLTAGRSYQYSLALTGGMPLSYQWYQNNYSLAGETNATFEVAAGAPGSASSYQVIVTNNYGAVTSLVSTLTVTTALQVTDYYERQILSYGPAGYWPLQETNAPAPGNWETNYGTLGPLGNAYYACTNASGAAFAQAGAIAGSSDFCVGLFGNGNSYSFVPRLTPALTLQAPFTLEAWVNMASAGYAVEIGEGGGTGLNGSGNYGGFQFGQGLQTYGNQFQMNYYTGVGNAQNEEQETNLFFTTGRWYHYVVTYDGNNSILYVNGQNIYTATSPNAVDTWSPLCIGGGKWDSGPIGAARWFNGLLDEVAIYTNVLSALEVTNHYLAGLNVNSNYFQVISDHHPLLYYRMDCPAYTSPDPAQYPEAVNYGSSPANGAYPPGLVPGGISGPPIAALGTKSVAAPINGVVSCVDAGFDPAFNPTGNQPFTAMTWFRTYPADGRTQTIMSHGGAASWGINLAGANGKVIWNSGAGSVSSTNILNDANWHFIAGVYDGMKNELYVDGALNAAATATHGITGNVTDDLWLGGDPDYTLVGANEQYLSGAIAQAAFFTNALTSSQLQAIYAAAILPPPPLALSIQNIAPDQIQLTWNYGALQFATNVTGPYEDEPGATSPFLITPANAQMYYRVRANP